MTRSKPKPQRNKDRSAAYLKEVRARLRTTQEGLAQALGDGTTKSDVSNYERGVSYFPERLIPALATVTDRTIPETREALGYGPDPHATDDKPQRVSVLAAILADPKLLPEAKEHLARQYGLLLRIQAAQPSDTVAELGHLLERQADLEDDNEDDAGSS